MRVYVEADYYPWESGWTWFEGGYSSDLSGYVPSNDGDVVPVLIYIDCSTNSVAEQAGDAFPLSIPPSDVDDQIPAAPEGSIPLACVFLRSSTTSIDWEDMYDLRLLAQPVGAFEPSSTVDNLTQGRLPVKGATTLEDSHVYESGTLVAVDDDLRLDGMLLGSPTNDTLREMFTHVFSAGIFTGGDLTDNGDGTVAVSAGTGLIRTGSDSSTPILLFDWSADPSVALTDNAMNYVYVDYNGGSPTISATTDYTTLDHSSQFILGCVYREGTTLYILEAGQEMDDFMHHNYRRGWEEERFVRVSGIVTSETGTRNLAITAGAFYAAFERFETNAVDTSGADTFTYYYRDGAGGWTKVTGETQIDNLHYDDGSGTLAELTANRYGVHWVFMLCNNDVAVVYGQGDYTLAQAKGAEVPSSLPNVVQEAGFVIAKIIIQKNASSFYSVETPWTTYFEGSIVTDHGALAGLGDDDHTQYVHNTTARTITAQHTFNPTAAGAPFVLGANAQGQLVTGLNADQLDGYHASDFAEDSGTPSSSFTINNDLDDVTVELIFGRTTGGSATLSWDGSTVALDKPLSITGDVSATGTAKLSGLANGYVPYHVSDASGLADSPIYTDGTDVSIGTTTLSAKLAVVPASSSDTVFSTQSLQSTAPLGSELVTNGTFDSDLSGWTIGGTGSGWAWDAAGKAAHSTGNTDTLYQAVSYTHLTLPTKA